MYRQNVVFKAKWRDINTLLEGVIISGKEKYTFMRGHHMHYVIKTSDGTLYEVEEKDVYMIGE